MNILSRDFTPREKVLIVILAILLLILTYYWLVDVPVRNGVAAAESKTESINMELEAVNAKIAGLQQMQAELDELGESGRAAYMASYNNAEAEYSSLNDILADTDEYVITFSELSKEDNLIRRQFTIQFTTDGYAAAKKIISDLENSQYRCRIGDINCAAEQSPNEDFDLRTWNGRILVSATATFYETMVGGVPDEGLPADEE